MKSNVIRPQRPPSLKYDQLREGCVYRRKSYGGYWFKAQGCMVTLDSGHTYINTYFKEGEGACAEFFEVNAELTVKVGEGVTYS